MKLKIIAILIFTLFLAATAFPVTANKIYIEKSKVSTTGTLQDLNLDLAVPNAFTHKINIFLGNGARGFTNKGDFAVGTFPAGITDGDFDFDGILDVVTTDYMDSTVTLMLGDGTGNFAFSGNYSVGTEPLEIINSDFNSNL